ncbi:alpha/beta-hydrolase [Gonapodya prolifera JEL478]|uniref:Carboxylic ester hydrolase n=1 Tax=Gonapodya prolifera (strain JEL478) TaxID=1344416 RepID=A0A139AS55_GONPJ|nr:alpha/beta-hydrolase [Gonapodya prolifera JEL478]|eukprot:KXS19474.1 alpha/beta-hydrolase [Gonapodya prolifera JEL478]
MKFFSRLIVALAALASATGKPLPRNYGSQSAPTVTVKNGTYSGTYSVEHNQEFFLGIPYAIPPKRFSLAQSLNSTWNATRDAVKYSPLCVGYGGDDVGYDLSEDCLYLNVIRPAGVDSGTALPVAVWIHGGGLFMGGSADRRYNLSFIVRNSVELGTPIVAVSINYRLSAYGFLASAEALKAGVANNGFRDQRLALHWIKENIASFGGDPNLITLWGESSGAESVFAHTIAYNGRDDGLFRGAIGQSGFGGLFVRYPGGLNNTAAMQDNYDKLVRNTSCASKVGTQESLTCLQDLPFAEINMALNVTAGATLGPWSPMLDGDFISDLPSKQLKDGRFVKVPLLVGSNTDEGTGFGAGRGPPGGVNTDADFKVAIAGILSNQSVAAAGLSAGQIKDQLMYLYPNIQALGIPSLDTWPELVTPNSTIANTLGLQFRRTSALFGDYTIHYTRRRANLGWSDHGVPSYAYRFDVIVNGVPPSFGAVHFQEVAFVFDNLNGDGYAVNPFATKPPSFKHLAKQMSNAWVNFVVSQDPNGDDGLDLPDDLEWPVYNATTGGGLGHEIVWNVNGSYVEVDEFRAPGINWLIEHAGIVFGN